MRPLRSFFSRLKALPMSGRHDADLARELEAHIQMLVDDNIRAGMPPDEARRQACLVLGGVASVEESCRDRRGFPFLRSVAQDTRYALRLLRRSPVFTIVAVLTLAIGIGATTAIFTLIDAVLLKSLPVRDPGGLVVVGTGRGQGVGSAALGERFSLFSFDLYQHLRATNLFDDLSAVQSATSQVAVRREGAADGPSVHVKLVSGNYFSVLGINAEFGRTLIPDDDTPSASPVAVVSHHYWTEELRSDPSVIGSVIHINRVAAQVIGVAPAGFFGETLTPDPPAVWLPLQANRLLDPERVLLDQPDSHWLYPIGRLRQGVTHAAAEAQLTATVQRWLLSRRGESMPDRIRTAIGHSSVPLTPGGSGITQMQRYYASSLRLLLGISAVVLLIVCANIANLLLARGTARRGENAVRAAVGATPRRLIRQALTESLSLALAGGALGVVIASAATKVLLAVAFRGQGYVPIETRPDARVLAFAFALSCCAALVFGLLPALRGADAAIFSRIKSPAGSFGLGNALIVAQVALSVVVLAAAGSFARSLAKMSNQHFGYDRDQILVANVEPARAGYDFNRLTGLYQRLDARLRAIPGVENVSLSRYSPFNRCCWGEDIAVDGYIPAKDEDRDSLLNTVSSRYFETLGTRVLAGRAIDERDTATSPPVAVVTQAFVRRFFPGENPLGKRIGIGDDMKGHGNISIVGVVEDGKYDDIGMDAMPMAFLPFFQKTQTDPVDIAEEQEHSFIRTIEIRGRGNAALLGTEVRRALAEVEPDMPILEMNTIGRDINLMLNQQNVISSLAGFFGLLALALTAIGLYGLMSWLVQRRTSEIGVRSALGAGRGDIAAMVMKNTLARCAAGVSIGVPAAFAAVRLLRSQLFEISPADPWNAIGPALAVIIASAAAGYLPASRASRLEPMKALKYE